MSSSSSSWRILRSFCLLVASVSISAPHCFDYFDMTTWMVHHLVQDFQLVDAAKVNDQVICTLMKACDHPSPSVPLVCDVYSDCFEDKFDQSSCRDVTSQKIPFYHLMCLAAKVLGAPPRFPLPGCRYGEVCELYPQVTHLDQTTTLPPLTTAPPTTTRPTTASTTTAAAVKPYSMDSSSSSSSSRIGATEALLDEQKSQVCETRVGSALLGILVISMIGNGALIAYLCSRGRGQPQASNVPYTDRGDDQPNETTSLNE